MLSLFGGRRGSRGQQTGVNSRDGQSDREEDGFVLLGETAIERTTVQYGQDQPGGAAPPPAYHQVATPQHLSLPVNNLPPTTNMNPPTTHQTALSDVPFTFSRQLAVAVGSSRLHVPPLRKPDLSQYNYDFRVERSVLREAGLLEEWEGRRNSGKHVAITESMETETVRDDDQTGETQDLMTFE
ncbi:uncharacterized protein [Branchiostoma lanceolatum]|uniref:uncharacterized protein n=1 Tax=Branchiostoma lanceolatum TaxID=7740 RepID=UPI003455EE26